MRRTSKARSRSANAKQVRALRSSKSHTRESQKTGDSPRRFESRQSRDMEVSVEEYESSTSTILKFLNKE